MSLSPGTRLGPYEILGPLGTGGMGEVYKAKDTRLDRTVAVKVLSGTMAADAEFRARFEREARTISQLNHPHICVLHDVGRFRPEDPSASQDAAVERDYLVMEYLEGKTLADRLEQGPLPLDQALKLATEIADALDRAHRQGVVHRDLKPGNVMLTKAGAKLLDFGLAKSGGAASPGGETQLVASPALAPLTARGTILGTFQYMAPEQLEGKDADARSDVWAFGCVLYEMLTGKRAFEGASQASLIGAILNHEPPPVSSLQATSPPMLDRVVRTCLAKDPDDRWQTVHDLSSELKWIAQSSAAGSGAVTPHTTPRQTLWRTGVIAASILAGAALAALWFSQQEPRGSAQLPVRAVAPLPPGMEIVVGARNPLALSPDGRLLAYSASNADGLQIFIRPLERFEATAVAGTQGGSGPFFSPKGDWLGFFVASEGRLKKVALSGGAPVVISEAPDVRGASWAPDDAIVFTGQLDGGLLRIAAGSRTAEELTKPDASRREKTHRFPDVLPNGKGVIFTIGAHDVTSFSDAKIAVYDFATRQTTVLIEGGSDAHYLAPGYLVYGRSGALMAVRFDAERLAVSGTPVPMIDGALTSGIFGPAHFAATPTGVLAYIPGTEPLDVNQLLIATRDGQATTIGERRYILAARASPSGDRATVRVGGANDTLWIQDLRRGGALSRITFRGNVSGAVWTPNSQRIIYNIGNEIASIAADGSGDDKTILQDQYTGIPTSITPDGKTLLYQTNRPATGWDIWALSIEEGKARPVLSAPFTERFARLSPDGRWIAYTSNESNRDEVYVRPYPALGSRAQVSRDGGSFPVWSDDGRELFFRRGSAVYVAKVIVTGVNFDSDTPVQLKTPQPLNVALDSMDYLPGGRLLLIQGTPRPLPTSLNLVTGWLGELAARVPIK